MIDQELVIGPSNLLKGPLHVHRVGRTGPDNVRREPDLPVGVRPDTTSRMASAGISPTLSGTSAALRRGYWGRYPHWHWGWANHNCNWWKWATAGAVTGWVVGSSELTSGVLQLRRRTFTTKVTTCTTTTKSFASTEEYAQQAQEIASSVPEVDPDSVEWLPLGIFALTQAEGSAEDATLFLQLAISKEGIIAGSFQNTATDEAFEVQGTIDRESQRAAWGKVDAKTGRSWRPVSIT